MSGEPLKEETPVPVTATLDGRGNSGADVQKYPLFLRDASSPYDAPNQALLHAISTKRFQPYVADGEETKIGVARYALNIALSESLYPAIHCLEIAIRNSIHSELCRLTGKADWYATALELSQNQLRLIEEAKSKLRDKFSISRRSLQAIEPDDVIAELPLGFWTAFFNKRASMRLASQLLKPVFRHAPRRAIQINHIRERAERFRTLRNRVFHHERIVHWSDLPAQHAEITEMLRWISPELASICQKHDRFEEVHHAGIKPWL